MKCLEENQQILLDPGTRGPTGRGTTQTGPHIEEENRGWMDVLFLGGRGNGPCKETLKRVSKFLPLDQDNHYSVGHISE
jgi:hypothetical protein